MSHTAAATFWFYFTWLRSGLREGVAS